MVESYTRDSLDPVKIAVTFAFLGAFSVLATKPGADFVASTPSGLQTIGNSLELIILGTVAILYVDIVGFIPYYRIYKQAPRTLKKPALRLLVSVGWLGIAGPIIGVTLNPYLPGIVAFSNAVSASFAIGPIVHRSQLAFILPSKALRLTVLDTRQGSPCTRTHGRWGKTSLTLTSSRGCSKA
jgi:hypothetical protein